LFKKQQGNRIDEMTKEMDTDNLASEDATMTQTKFVNDQAFDSSDVQITFVPEPILDTTNVQIQFVSVHNPEYDGDEPIVKQRILDPSKAFLSEIDSMGAKAEQAIYEESDKGSVEKQQKLAQEAEDSNEIDSEM
jgi:hypothetical protein